MKLVTPEQLLKLQDLIVKQKKVPADQMQALLGGGYIADLLDANVEQMNRETFRRMCGLTIIAADVPDSRLLTCSHPFDPAAFIGTGWSVAEQDERTLALTQLDVTKVSFETCLKQGEHRIIGEVKLTRLQARPDLVPLGAPQCQALWEDYKANGAHSLLEWLRQEQGITYLDFFGTVLRGPSGYRYVLYLCWSDGEWFWGCHWLDGGWSAGDRSAALARSELGT